MPRSQFLKAVSKKKEAEPIREMADSRTGEGNIQGNISVKYFVVPESKKVLKQTNKNQQN